MTSDRQHELSALVPAIVDEVIPRFDPLRVLVCESPARAGAGLGNDNNLYAVSNEFDVADRVSPLGGVRAGTSPLAPIDIPVTDVAEFEPRKYVNGSRSYSQAGEGEVVYEGLEGPRP